MRMLHGLFALILCLLHPMVGVLAFIAEGLGGLAAGHFHLLPSTPRSILETRRLGLA